MLVARVYMYIYIHTYIYTYVISFLKLHHCNQTCIYKKLNVYGDNGERSFIE